ncbi:Na(+)/citrate cotransporter-like [Mytilus californianus]|uniref:Na(+)/citrate cotransporter-like n=1 Tax=Mytilus californianus TaxID=6549 RepID=UPI0022452CE4|nr:Na(+)/citrate cotransporter-like [Mytilus californianus]
MGCTRVLRDLWEVKRTLIVIVVPLLLLPLPLLVDSSEAKCAYGLAVMAIFWITETLPLAVTSLLPVIVFPLFGVMKAGDVASNYIKDSSIFGIGGLTLAVAVEKWNLHKRIALRVLLMFGSKPKWLMFGFMLPTWFLSMWVSNTATTAMMIPIVGAVMEQLKEVNEVDEVYEKGIDNSGFVKSSNVEEQPNENGVKDYHITYTENGEVGVNEVQIEVKEKQNKEQVHHNYSESNEYKNMCKAMTLCVAYSANIGGTGTLSGTGPNIIMQGQADLVFQRVGIESSGINFVSWMIFALPGSIICLALLWIWLQIWFLGISFAEIVVLVHFVLLILLWFSRKPPYVDGWGSWFKTGYLTDSASAILIVTSMFVFPSVRPAVLCFRKTKGFPKDDRPHIPVPPILDWPTVEKKFPWGVLLLIGGGFALADACEKSGLSSWIGSHLEAFKELDTWVMVLLFTALVAVCTEVTSNTATITLLLPILGDLAVRLQLNPLYLMFPCAIATSFAFMLPVATPPNAIVFATGYITVKDMASAGFMVNILCILVLNVAVNTWGMAYFNLNVVPPEFINGHNATMNMTTVSS